MNISKIDIEKRMGKISRHITQVVENKYIYGKFSEYLEKNNIDDMHPTGDFLRFVVNNYRDMAIIDVCKHIDRNPKAESLLKLLKEIIDNGMDSISYNSDIAYYDIEYAQYFNKRTQKLMKKTINEDIKRLNKKIGRKSKRFRDSILKLRHTQKAHIDKKDFKSKLVHNDLDEAIDLLEKIVLKYNTLIFRISQPDSLLAVNKDDYLDLNALFKSSEGVEGIG